MQHLMQQYMLMLVVAQWLQLMLLCVCADAGLHMI